MLFHKLYGNYLVHFRSFSENSIVELFVLDTIIGHIYFKGFLCKEYKYPTITSESADMLSTIPISRRLYLKGNLASILYETDDLIDLLINALNGSYNKYISNNKMATPLMRDLDIYPSTNNQIELVFTRNDKKPIYFKLNRINKKDEMYSQMMQYYNLLYHQKYIETVMQINTDINNKFDKLNLFMKKINFKYDILNCQIVNIESNVNKILSRHRLHSI
jgi:hypothetical protein